MSSQKATVQRYTEGFCRGGSTLRLQLDRMVEEGDTIAVVGHGSVDASTGGPVDFVYSQVFTFTDGLVSRLDTFRVWLCVVQPQQ